MGNGRGKGGGVWKRITMGEVKPRIPVNVRERASFLLVTKSPVISLYISLHVAQ